jgi:hypothetical protein
MRYVILIVGLTVFIIWDMVKNEGAYLDMAARFVRNLFRMIGA